MPRVGFVTCARWPEIADSDALVARALRTRGVEVMAVPWNAPGPDPAALDALVLRSNWDYHFTPAAFTAWLDGIERAGRRVWNPPALVRWNLTKRYLIELAAAGLPEPPLYARIDGVERLGGFTLMEVEVNEPGLFFDLAPAAAERFAEAISARLAGR